jgi:hypothetical protein
MGLLIGALGAKVAGDGAIVVEVNPFHLLVEPTANRNVEIGDLTIIEGVACGWLIEGCLIVKDSLLQGV